MTINEAITSFDALMPNVFSFERKKEELSRLDKRVFEDIYTKYRDNPVENFEGYAQDSSPDTALIIPFPYDDIYIDWLAMKADLINGDIMRYNNSAGVFNAKFEEFCRAYNRCHLVVKNVTLEDDA